MLRHGDIINGKFKVESIVFQNEETGYRVIKCKVQELHKNSSEPVKLQFLLLEGYFHMVFDGDILTAIGELQINKKGRSLKVTEYEVVFPIGEKAILEFFSKRKSRIAKRYICRIIEIYGENLFSVILNDDTALDASKLKGMSIPEDTRKKIIHIVKTCFTFSRLMNFLTIYGISPSLTNKIYNAYAENSMNIIKDNPYRLYYSAEIPFSKLEILAKKFDKPYNFKERIQKGIISYLDKRIEKNGDIYVEREDLIKGTAEYLKNSKIYPEDVPYMLIEEMLDKAPPNIIDRRFINNKELIYKTYIKNVENDVVENLLSKFLLKESFLDKELVRDTIEELGNNLDIKQKEAICNSITHFISIITGGPGTGKTHTINTLIKVLERLNPEVKICLLAPTGRASRRMEEMTKFEAKTIHRGIGLRYSHLPTTEIDADVIIIDEVSMVDLVIFSHLLKNIKEGAKIILVGDEEQLPSVGAGCVLKDLIASKVVPYVKLEKIFRQQSENGYITQNSHHLIKQEFDKMVMNKGDFFFIEENNIDMIRKKIIRSMVLINKKYGIPFSDMMILTPVKQQILGTMDLNQAIQEYFNDKNKDNKVFLDNQEFRLGDPVIQLENCYDEDREVMNGEIGRIISVDKAANMITVKYDSNKIIDYTNREAHEIALAYAITVHKSQGSEFPVVFMPIHDIHAYSLNKNLTYTSWTRAKQMVVNVGSLNTLYQTSLKNAEERNSILPYLLSTAYNNKKREITVA